MVRGAQRGRQHGGAPPRCGSGARRGGRVDVPLTGPCGSAAEARLDRGLVLGPGIIRSAKPVGPAVIVEDHRGRRRRGPAVRMPPGRRPAPSWLSSSRGRGRPAQGRRAGATVAPGVEDVRAANATATNRIAPAANRRDERQQPPPGRPDDARCCRTSEPRRTRPVPHRTSLTGISCMSRCSTMQGPGAIGPRSRPRRAPTSRPRGRRAVPSVHPRAPVSRRTSPITASNTSVSVRSDASRPTRSPRAPRPRRPPNSSAGIPASPRSWASVQNGSPRSTAAGRGPRSPARPRTGRRRNRGRPPTGRGRGRGSAATRGPARSPRSAASSRGAPPRRFPRSHRAPSGARRWSGTARGRSRARRRRR